MTIKEYNKLMNEIKHLRETKIPRCILCKKDFINAIDSITKKESKYLWKPTCKCFKKSIHLSVG